MDSTAVSINLQGHGYRAAMSDQELLSVNDAATRKGVPLHVIQKGIDSGALPAVQQGNAQFVRPDDLEQWEPHVKSATGADFNDAEAADYLRTPDAPS